MAPGGSPCAVRALVWPRRTPNRLGLNTAQMAELALERCAVPAENRLGDEGAGSALFTHAMTWERSMILAGAVGAMQRLLETCLEFSESRIQFGQPGTQQIRGTTTLEQVFSAIVQHAPK